MRRFRAAIAAKACLWAVMAFLAVLPARMAQAQVTQSARIELNDQKTRIYFGKDIFITPDYESALDERTLLARYQNNIRGERNNSNTLNLGLAASPVWMTFSVTNLSSTEDWVLDFGRLLDGRQGLAQRLYIRNATSGEIITKRLNKPNDIGGERIFGPAITLSIPKQQTQLFTAYLEANGHFANTYTPFFVSEQRYIESLRHGSPRSLLLSLFFLVCFGFFLCLCVLKHDPQTLLFCGYYAALWGLSHVMNDTLLAGGFFESVLPGFLLISSAILALFMTRGFLDITSDDHSHNTFIFALGAFILGTFLVSTMLFSGSSPLDEILIFIPSAIAFAALSGISFTQAQKGKYGGQHYATAWAFVFCGFVMSGLAAAGNLPPLFLNAFWVSLLPQSALMIYATLFKTYRYDEDQRLIAARQNRAAQSVARLQQSKDAADQARLLRVIERERELMSELREREIMRTADMRKAKDSADEANRAKSAFLAVVSHEIRTPMTGIMGMVRLLLDTKMSKQQHDYVQEIQNSGDTMMAMLNDILDFEKIENGHLELESIPCDIPRIIQGISTLMSGHAAQKKITIKSDIPPQFPHSLSGDPTRLRQVLLNLVNNGIKFTDRGGVSLGVSIVASDQAPDSDQIYDHVRFTVEDTGIGISAEAQKKLFKPFEQADKTTTRKYGGTGLGLAICQHLVEAMGGHIDVESVEGQGSLFSFTLKMRRSEDVIASPTPQEAAVTTPPMRIVVVDDNAVNRKVIQEFLLKDHHHVHLCESAEEALEALPKDKFDLVLCDINLQGMSGIEFTKTVRKLDDRAVAATPVVALTGSVSAEEIESYYEANMNGVLEKPLDPAKLRNVLAQVHHDEMDQYVILPDRPEFSAALAQDEVNYFQQDNLDEAADNAADDALRKPESIPLEELAWAETDEAFDSFQAALEDGDDTSDLETPLMPDNSDIVANSSSDHLIDRGMIANLCESLGQSAYDDLMTGFWEKTDEITDALADILDSKDMKAAYALGHDLKGMAANFGLTGIADIAREIESHAKAEDINAVIANIIKLPDIKRDSRAAIDGTRSNT